MYNVTLVAYSLCAIQIQFPAASSAAAVSNRPGLELRYSFLFDIVSLQINTPCKPIPAEDPLLGSPFHSSICENQRRQPVEDLVVCAAVSVEDGIIICFSHWVLSVGGNRVCSDALLRLRAC